MSSVEELKKQGWEVDTSVSALQKEGWEIDKTGMEHKIPSSVSLPKADKVGLAFRRLLGEEPEGRLGKTMEPFRRGFIVPDERRSVEKWFQDEFPGVQPHSVNVDGDTYYAGRTKEGDLKYLNPPGFDLSDIGHFLGAAGPETAAAMSRGPQAAVGQGLLKAPATALWRLMSGGPGRRAMLGELAQQAGQTGYNPEGFDPARSAGQIGLAGAEEGIPAWAMTKFQRPVGLLSGRGLEASPETRADLMAIRDARNIGTNIPTPMPHQVSQNQVLRTTANQAEATNRLLQTADARKRQELLESAETIPGLLNVKKGAVGQELKDIGIPAAERISAAYQGPIRSQEFAGKQFVDAASGVQQADWAQLKKGYSALDNIAAREKPVFDLSRAKGLRERTAAYGLTTPEEVPGAIVDIKGKPLTSSLVRDYINVAKGPEGRVARVVDLIEQLDDTQVDYKVIKELRTQVGYAIESMPWENNQANGIAKKVYGELSAVIKNPVSGKGDFTKAFSDINNKAVSYYDMVGDQKFKKILQNQDNLANLANDFLGNPANINKNTRDILSRMPKQRDNLRLSMTSRILNSDTGAQQAIRNLEKSNIDAYNFMFPGTKQREYVKRLAGFVDEWKASPVQKALRQTSDRVNIGKELLNNNMLDTQRSVELLNLYGGKGTRGHDLLRVSALDNLITSSTKPDKTGQFVLDSKMMHDQIRSMEQSGVWGEILTKEDKTRINGIAAALRVNASAGADVGTSLQRATAVANLRHPATFLQGLHTLTVNKGLAWAISNPNVGDWYFKAAIGGGGDPISKRTLENIGVLLGSTASYISGFSQD